MSDDVDVLLKRVAGSSNRLRVAMVVTAGLCLLISAGIAADRSVWHSGWGWRTAGLAGVVFFAAAAGVLLYGGFSRQRRHSARLRDILLNHPQRIRSIRLLVARASPMASWAPDDGSASRGLHVVVTDEAGATWLLPVSRANAEAVVASLARRCPRAAVEP